MWYTNRKENLGHLYNSMTDLDGDDTIGQRLDTWGAGLGIRAACINNQKSRISGGIPVDLAGLEPASSSVR